MSDTKLNRAITDAPHGIGIDALVQKLGKEASRRTLLRRLEEMVGRGEIERIGKARATKYHAIKKATANLPRREMRHEMPERESMVVREDTPTHEPAGSDATLRELRDVFREHYSLRKPVGYRREFLDAYVPNETAYLPASLCEHLRAKGQSAQMAELPPGTYARQVLDRLIIDLSWNSSRLEGSTYSLLETDFLLQQGHSDDPMRHKEARMILNHKAAIEFLVDSPDALGFNRYTFLNLHSVLTEGLLKNWKAEGALRTCPVGIGGSVFHPTSNPAVIEECFDLILQKAAAIRDPLECCFFLMVQMPYLQPFEDGNKRTSRLAANIPLIRANMSPLSFVSVPVQDYTTGVLGVYELNRIELLREVFVHAYEQSASRYAAIRDELGEPEPILLRYRNEIADFIREVVVKRLGKLDAAALLRRWAGQNITASERARFIEVVEERLLSLSEGSIVRVRVRPSEFEAWWPVWNEVRPK
ncbi:MAG: Fic family protein [Prosthecobacter sp.]|uniref:Fic family protein n=1 Tax=Prosthecobacter sp. TaxID=1965333 RepID=UPI0038FEA297